MGVTFLFSGIGSSIVGAITGALITAAISIPVSYQAGKRSILQKQKAGNEAKQIQIGVLNEKQE